MKLLTGNSNPTLAQAVAARLDLPLTRAQVKRFADNEVWVTIDENVRGEDVFVLQSTSYPANDHLMELLICIDALKRASARRITAVTPYFGYARQDRKTGGRTPISAKLVANLITRAGSDRVLTMDLHSPQIQGFFDVPVDNLYAAPVLNDFVEALGHQPEDRVVVSPDVGSIKRAIGHAKRLGAGLAIVDKRRDNALDTRQEHLIGQDVDGKVAIMFDDMVTTGGSITGAAAKLKECGAKEIYVAITHGVFCGKAVEKIEESPITTLGV